MRKTIRFERRISSFPRTLFNYAVEWEPRLIVWPEYDGLAKEEAREMDDDTNREWGKILLGALATFARSHSMVVFGYQYVQANKWEQLRGKYNRPRYVLKGRFELTEGSIARRPDASQGLPIFLVAPSIKENELPRVIEGLDLDRARLLPYGEAIFTFGIDDGFLEISFNGDAESFLEILHTEARTQGYEAEEGVAFADRPELKKAICFEHRTTNSPRVHFNRTGDWRPRLIVWPEYDGEIKDEFGELREDTDNEWGQIIARTLKEFARLHSLQIFAYELVWPRLGERIFDNYSLPEYRLTSEFAPTDEYINWRQDFGHEIVVFLLAAPAQESHLPRVIRGLEADRANLLPYGEAIFVLGIEEAVLEITFANHESSFLDVLRTEADAHGHLFEQGGAPFISHWVIANHKTFGDDWRKF